MASRALLASGVLSPLLAVAQPVVGTEPFLVKQIMEQDEIMQNPTLTVGMIHAHP